MSEIGISYVIYGIVLRLNKSSKDQVSFFFIYFFWNRLKNLATGVNKTGVVCFSRKDKPFLFFYNPCVSSNPTAEATIAHRAYYMCRYLRSESRVWLVSPLPNAIGNFLYKPATN